ncbi:MAG: magnesium transporter, partial [Mycolicibacterium aromaticivorans]|nr:magnesium transporter [Mycolicibacterium aromaticivorans]
MTYCRTRLWVDGVLKAEDFPLQEASNHLAERNALVWVDMCNPDHDVLCELAQELGFDQHAIEDTVAHAERTKATRYATHTFLTVYATALA